jgi:hypothetical protein
MASATRTETPLIEDPTHLLLMIHIGCRTKFFFVRHRTGARFETVSARLHERFFHLQWKSDTPTRKCRVYLTSIRTC